MPRLNVEEAVKKPASTALGPFRMAFFPENHPCGPEPILIRILVFSQHLRFYHSTLLDFPLLKEWIPSLA
jgi:hypothetical protein